MDQTSLKNLATLHPKFRASAVEAWSEAQANMPSNVSIVVIEGLRSFQESDRDYQIGRTVKGENASDKLPMGEIITKAAAGQSYHDYGLAFDFEMFTNGKPDYIVGPNWMKVVSIMESHGMTWGGNFPDGFHDNPHFENRYGLNWRTLLELYNSNKFLPGTTFVDF